MLCRCHFVKPVAFGTRSTTGPPGRRSPPAFSSRFRAGSPGRRIRPYDARQTAEKERCVLPYTGFFAKIRSACERSAAVGAGAERGGRNATVAAACGAPAGPRPHPGPPLRPRLTRENETKAAKRTARGCCRGYAPGAGRTICRLPSAWVRSTSPAAGGVPASASLTNTERHSPPTRSAHPPGRRTTSWIRWSSGGVGIRGMGRVRFALRAAEGSAVPVKIGRCRAPREVRVRRRLPSGRYENRNAPAPPSACSDAADPAVPELALHASSTPTVAKRILPPEPQAARLGHAIAEGHSCRRSRRNRRALHPPSSPS
jgi:hypothetical protein